LIDRLGILTLRRTLILGTNMLSVVEFFLQIFLVAAKNAVDLSMGMKETSFLGISIIF
jgi:hypothetical protein